MSAIVENIPDADSVSRHIFYPRMYDADRNMLWGEVFQFPKPEDNSAPHESAAWRKYLPNDASVHDVGISREAKKTPPFRYEGFISATALLDAIDNGAFQ